MRAWKKAGVAAVLAAALGAAGFGQSLVEAARRERARQRQTLPPAHVYTNDDFPARPPAAAPAQPSPREKPPAETQPPPDQAKRPSESEVRAAVRAQKEKVRELETDLAEVQHQLDDWNRAVAAGMCVSLDYTNIYADWCRLGPKLAVDYDKTAAQLAKAQTVLEEMQEEARRMGFRSSVYDPQ